MSDMDKADKIVKAMPQIWDKRGKKKLYFFFFL